MFCTWRMKSGARWTGSTSPSSVRFGSAPETTALAEICSPLASVTPVAVSSVTSIRVTSASVRISAPPDRAAAARASASAPGPPAVNHPVATGCPSPAPSRSRMAAVPADLGPRKDPAMPPEATVARSGSLSNHSPTRSATAIGIQRNSRYASALPSARNARPVLRISIRSAAFGSSSAGGVISQTRRSTRAMAAKLERNRG